MNDKLKQIKPDTRPYKENDSSRKDETVINRLRAGHALQTPGYLIEGLSVLNVSCLTLIQRL